ncbi:mechanosensitive ion channel family protein [Macrococcus brunensis]|uniref:Mechanosensitive ion channel family protein n=1 Tax=Macrococcus brunensis TaxID=198483 RepID=A0A4R6BBH6_9STAP|nr:mechanosensitive ion channel family protein [Macrococcus brunensis]TDL94332.1 mechanosensitive ion channel family protein [Macrococcus brunensis]ULG71938.1 mechanosensitive ion channel family protein [Macrococcus brunensis]ULG74184.1 mechanosensitive ion channel family protein [Macrococcus brunensis]
MEKHLINPLLDSEMWKDIGVNTFWSIIIILVAFGVIKVLHFAIAQFFKVRRLSNLSMSEKRDTTLIKLLQNITTYVVWFVVLTTVLSNMGIKVESLIAGAGIAGIALGFGAQTLVKDVITGFFIIFESQFDVGDYVRINTGGTKVAEGTVQSIGLRSTRIRSFTGELTILPNGTMNEIVNFSVNNSVAVFEVSISSEENIRAVEEMLTPYLLTLKDKYEDVVKTPEILGVDMVKAGEAVIKIAAETLPNNHVKVSRLLRGDLKDFLDSHGVKAPVPRMVMYNQPKGGPEHE